MCSLCDAFMFISNGHLVVVWKLTSLASHAQGAKKVIFTACHSGKLKLTLNVTSQTSFQLAPKTFWWARASDISRKKKQNSAGFLQKKVKFRRIFRGKFLEKSADFTGNFGGNFVKKQSVKSSQFRWIFVGKFP